ncbi:MAG: hypothetical protein K2J00_04965 [Bacteroidaceae bacterium]|nr:hypothetical protein [Bacteroidaceae bacterium]
MRINLISDKNKSHGNDDTDSIFPEKQQVESSSKTAGTALVLCAEKTLHFSIVTDVIWTMTLAQMLILSVGQKEI